MKLIEALKQTKDLQRKASDIREKIGTYCADMTSETPTYGTEEQQREQVAQWLQAHSDILKEILRLRIAIQRTNLATKVNVNLNGVEVVKTIAEWVHRRKDLAALDLTAYKQLSDKGLPAIAKIQNTSKVDVEVRIRRYFNPKERDERREMYTAEPSLIDGRLEVANAVTDLIE